MSAGTCDCNRGRPSRSAGKRQSPAAFAGAGTARLHGPPSRFAGGAREDQPLGWHVCSPVGAAVSVNPMAARRDLQGTDQGPAPPAATARNGSIAQFSIERFGRLTLGSSAWFPPGHRFSERGDEKRRPPCPRARARSRESLAIHRRQTTYVAMGGGDFDSSLSTVSSALHFFENGLLTPEGGLPYKPPIDDALPPPTGGRKRVSDAPHDFDVVTSPVKPPEEELSALHQGVSP